MQIRVGKIGLQAFLYYKRVPGHISPLCLCGQGHQTPKHLFTACQAPQSAPLRAMGYTTIKEMQRGLLTPQTAGEMAQAFLRSGWLKEYRLAKALRNINGMANAMAGWSKKPPPERNKKGAK